MQPGSEPGRTSTVPGTCEGKGIVLARDDFGSGVIEVEAQEDSLRIVSCMSMLALK